jgi:hypothetical protein
LRCLAGATEQVFSPEFIIAPAVFQADKVLSAISVCSPASLVFAYVFIAAVDAIDRVELIGFIKTQGTLINTD